MKVAVPKENVEKAKPKPLLSLIPTEEDEATPSKENLRTFDLLSDPADANSPKYKAMIRILNGNETLHTTIEWVKDVNRILEGLGINNNANKTKIVNELLRGSALTSWWNELVTCATDQRNERAQAAYRNTPGARAAKEAA